MYAACVAVGRLISRMTRMFRACSSFALFNSNRAMPSCCIRSHWLLLALSLVHIVLEFPLDSLALRQLGAAIGQGVTHMVYRRT